MTHNNMMKLLLDIADPLITENNDPKASLTYFYKHIQTISSKPQFIVFIAPYAQSFGENKGDKKITAIEQQISHLCEAIIKANNPNYNLLGDDNISQKLTIKDGILYIMDESGEEREFDPDKDKINWATLNNILLNCLATGDYTLEDYNNQKKPPAFNEQLTEECLGKQNNNNILSVNDALTALDKLLQSKLSAVMKQKIEAYNNSIDPLKTEFKNLEKKSSFDIEYSQYIGGKINIQDAANNIVKIDVDPTKNEQYDHTTLYNSLALVRDGLLEYQKLYTNNSIDTKAVKEFYNKLYLNPTLLKMLLTRDVITLLDSGKTSDLNNSWLQNKDKITAEIELIDKLLELTAKTKEGINSSLNIKEAAPPNDYGINTPINKETKGERNR